MTETNVKIWVEVPGKEPHPWTQQARAARAKKAYRKEVTKRIKKGHKVIEKMKGGGK
jgi:hypothetical protein